MEEVKKFDISNRLYFLILAIIAGVMMYGATSVWFWFFGDDLSKEITVQGEGKAYVKPDVAIMTLGVKTEGAKSNDVVNDNNAKMSVIIKAIKDLGIDAKDIKTSSYNLYPVYDYTRVEGTVLKGYALDQQITVKVRNFDKISSVLDSATSNGANNIGNLQITVENLETVKTEARNNAIAAAKAKAAELAKQSGIKLGKVIDISESSGGYAPMMYEKNIQAAGLDAAAPTAQIEVGQKEITVDVSLTYKVK